MIRIQQLKLPLDYDENMLVHAAAARLRVSPARIRSVELVRRSIDARKKPDICYVLTVDAELEQEARILKKNRNPNVSAAVRGRYTYPEPGTEPLAHRPVIVGCGPAGLFCALLLARAGYRPLILERGEDVDSRTEKVERFWRTGTLDTESNVQFGEGGAGTFSDGKLNTMVKESGGRNRFVLETFVGAGADPDILYGNKPHIGTDVLRAVVKHIRREIEELGGEVRFQSCLTDLRHSGGRLTGIVINGTEEMPCSVLVLAIGHSARDTFAMLSQKPVRMESKPFAVGLRIQHPQEMINVSQYGEGYPDTLPAADYKLTARLASGRGVYTFCMCPGGYVVNASSEAQALAVNGMSYRARDARNANSAVVVTVSPQDFADPGVLGGVEFQRRLERFAYRAGGGKIPVQLFGDFCQGTASSVLGEVEPCCRGGWQLADLSGGLPAFLVDSLTEGIRQFERKIPGFARADAVLAGVESRTSSPVRILRGEDKTASLGGVYPCGEGAGYAGGITSAAMDGMKTAEAIIKKYRKI